MEFPLHTPFAERWFNAYEHYRYSRLIYAVWPGMAVLFTATVTRMSYLKHGEWIDMTVFVVLGVLQFQGAVYSKAVERMPGTVIRLDMGLAVLWLSQHYPRGGLPFYLTIGAVSMAASWVVASESGYIPVLMGLIMCMLISDSGTEWLDNSLMRTSNALLGAVIAIGAAKLLPLKSTLMWRFMLADNLTACSRILAGVDNGRCMTRERLKQNMIKMRQISARMVKSRSHLAAISGESHINPAMIEAMQHTHRKTVNSTKLLLNTAAKLSPPDVSAEGRNLSDNHFQRLQRDLRLTARPLKGHYTRCVRIDIDIDPRLGRLVQYLPFE